MAARETGALQAAKNKLVKQVEDLTLRLQLEKRMRADMEEAKQQENEKLQSALQEMQLQFKETKSLLQKEREAAKREAERVPVVQEVEASFGEATHVYEKLENGHHVVEDQKATETQTVTPVKKFGTESDSKLRRSYIERRHENVDSLINCVMKNTGFHHGKPIAAFTIYKCLLHWKSFEAESTSVFDRLIHMIGSAIENQDDNDLMAYWLSNTSALLFLVQQRSGGSNDAAPVRKPPNPTSLFGRMTMAPRTSKGVLRSGRSFSKDSPMGHW
ncbi:hypothetical protein P8452_08312 [Trifolium repens]|nr:hypothetical protein P8452_08312 [Trifolium repens]